MYVCLHACFRLSASDAPNHSVVASVRILIDKLDSCVAVPGLYRVEGATEDVREVTGSTYIHACIHTFIHTHIHTYINT